MNWLAQALTGADNRTVAIGRLIGMAIALVLLVALPLYAAWRIAEGMSAATWAEYLSALTVYVPAVTLAVGGLIWGTAKTEPAPTDKDGGQ